MITRLLAGGAIVVSAALGLSAPADADPAFDQLVCSCQTPGAEHGPTVEERINRGIQDAHAR